MKKDEALSKEFLSQFKTGEDLFAFMKELQKRRVEQFLEAEMDEHLGYEKNQVSENKNARNGHTIKKIKTSFGENEILVPRDRDSSFDSIAVPKRRNMIDGLENIIISLYAKGMGVSDIQEQIKDIYEFDVSTSAISRITDRVTNDIV
jgi:putative transposase